MELENALFIFFVTLLWVAGISLFPTITQCLKRMEHSRYGGIVVSLGTIPFLAWILRLAIVPISMWHLWDGATALLLIYGGFIMIQGRHRSSESSDAILTLSNDFGIFRIDLRLMDHEYHWAGKTLAELNLRKRDLLVLAILRGDEVIPFPKGPEVVVSGDELLIFGRIRELRTMSEVK